MQITNTMNLSELNERTQNALTTEQCEALRELLMDSSYETTEDVPETEWLNMLEEAAQ